MENISMFIFAALTALAVENAIFARSLGLFRKVLFIERPRNGILYGLLLTWMITISSILISILNAVFIRFSNINIMRFPVYLLCVSIIYVCTYLYSKSRMPAIFDIIESALPISTFNSALFGSFYVSATQGHNYFQAIGYAFGSGIGYTIAILIIYYARKRLAISPVPRSFRGLPILMVYIGFLSLAIYGLIGHALPN